MIVEPRLVANAAAESRRALAPGVDRSWSAPAGDLEWTCLETGVHIASSLVWYASQVIKNDPEGFLPFDVVLEEGAGPRDLLELIEVSGIMLARVAAAADPGDRAFHFFGVSDPGGFVAMGTLETLVHTHDIALGLGIDWNPPDHLCAPVLARLFPDAPASDPSAVLLWCTGRAALGDRPRRERWRWDPTVRE